ncbi:hypothetical protein GCM10025864_28610 [Luteimicrobium album]|uniref:Glycosyl/glycerophosphate transferase n=1 Tax=Luteimicrobium album TaxID=1054550 RepID=A0ABQ6I3P4_9MICO|nr:hypothetical protein GCM10025864_28610 [Luteimicrobium album]
MLVSSGRATGQITAVDLTDDGLSVGGWLRAPRDTSHMTLRLSGKAGEVSAPLVVAPDGRFTVLLPVDDRGGNPLSTTFGFVIKADIDGQELWLPASRTLLDGFPLDLENGRIAATVTSTPGAGAAWVRFRSRFAEDERSRRDQARMIEEYRALPPEPLDAVLFETFSGRTAGDSPLALSAELHRSRPDIAQYWSVATLATPVPEWSTPVLRHSREWFRILAGARYLVNNANWPWFFVKKEHQLYLQTWHGTPLKRIGNDVPGASLSLSYRELMVREAAAWDVLLAQNEYSAEIFPEAFDYRGPVLVEGYPRNDSLFGAGAADVRRRLRAGFDIDDDVQVLLYAPTWRDNLKGAGGYGRVTYLDFDAVVADAAVTGRRTVILYRGHSNTAGSAAALPPEVIDVTSYPDVNDLMLASDALVTDYSSIMFDYAVTRKPIYFLVPDLALYSSTTRGFYRDLAEIAPGPLCATTGEVLAALVEDNRTQFGERYDLFVAEFAPLDDGNASQRVLAKLPGLGVAAPVAGDRAATA